MSEWPATAVERRSAAPLRGRVPARLPYRRHVPSGLAPDTGLCADRCRPRLVVRARLHPLGSSRRGLPLHLRHGGARSARGRRSLDERKVLALQDHEPARLRVLRRHRAPHRRRGCDARHREDAVAGPRSAFAPGHASAGRPSLREARMLTPPRVRVRRIRIPRSAYRARGSLRPASCFVRGETGRSGDMRSARHGSESVTRRHAGSGRAPPGSSRGPAPAPGRSSRAKAGYITPY